MSQAKPYDLALQLLRTQTRAAIERVLDAGLWTARELTASRSSPLGALRQFSGGRVAAQAARRLGTYKVRRRKGLTMRTCFVLLILVILVPPVGAATIWDVEYFIRGDISQVTHFYDAG